MSCTEHCNKQCYNGPLARARVSPSDSVTIKAMPVGLISLAALFKPALFSEVHFPSLQCYHLLLAKGKKLKHLQTNVVRQSLP